MYINALAPVRAPSDDLAAPIQTQLLAGTGTTEAHNATALVMGGAATLQAGENAIRVSFRSAAGGAAQVATTSMRIAAGTSVNWYVTKYDQHVYVEAADGASAYEAWVWTSNFAAGA